jgi:hypothetical protein
MGGAWAPRPGHAQEEKERRERRGGNALLGFANEEKRERVQGKVKRKGGMVPCNDMVIHVTRLRGDGSLPKKKRDGVMVMTPS